MVRQNDAGGKLETINHIGVALCYAIILSGQFTMSVKQNLVSMVESVPIFSKVSTATVMGLDTLEPSVK